MPRMTGLLMLLVGAARVPARSATFRTGGKWRGGEREDELAGTARLTFSSSYRWSSQTTVTR